MTLNEYLIQNPSNDMVSMTKQAILTVSNSITNEDSGTENHFNRTVFQKLIQQSDNFYYHKFLPNIINNHNISFDSVQTDYDTAVAEEYNNIANSF
jgi:hypothetical protein